MSADLAYQAVFQSVSDAILVLSEEGRAINCNPAALTLLRCTREELIGTTPNDWSPEYQPDGRRSDDASTEIIGAVMRGEVMRFDWTNRRSDGTLVEVDVTVSLMESGSHRTLAVISRDITEQVKAADALTKRVASLTQPVSGNLVSFEELFSLDEIQRIQDDFAAATGVASIITHIDGTPITAPSNFTALCSGIIRKTEQGCANCYKSDAAIGRYHPSGPIVQPCLSGGLWDAGASITLDGQHIANWLIGQVRDETQTEEGMRAYARTIGADEMQFMQAFHEVPAMSRDQFEKVAQALFTLANQLSTRAYQNVLQARYITERVRAEEAVQESRERYRGLSEASSEAIFISEKGVCLEQNPQAERMFGYTLAEAVGRMGAEWIAPEDRETVMKHIRAGYEQPYEVRGLRKDGSTFPALVRGRMMHYQNRNVRVTSISDITAIKQAEAALKESEERWKFALEGSGAGVWDWNIQTGDALFSARWKEMIGYAENEIENAASEWSSRVYPEDLPKVMAALQDHMDGKTPAAHVEFRMLCKDESWLWILGRGMVVSRDADGKPLRLVGTNTDVSERKAATEKIEHLAFYDPLTGLPNRRLLTDRLTQALTSSARHNRYGALMLLDMDDFKRLNDTMGHDVGDQFLVEVARRLQASVREGDTVARHGGDEFVLILKDLSEDTTAPMQAEQVAVKILKAVSEPYTLNLLAHQGECTTRSYHCTSSIGITLFRGNTLSGDELMRRADTAMYQAKAEGRNSLRFFDPEMQTAVTARAALDDDLREAVLRHQFTLHYQPQVDGEGRVTGAEALLRWSHPQRGMVSPIEFIPLAEASGMILPLGHWVLQTACAQLVSWATDPQKAQLTLAVNVSARQLKMPNFVEEVLAVLAHHGANPQRLKLELTESLLVDDVDGVIAKMTALKAKGIGFSLDDFGTGYSSLAYLKRLPLDQLKIDRSFVRDVLSDPNDATIARTIVALAKSMGIAVIAEGVETEAQRDFLAANGCMAYQGYLFGRPVAIEEF